MKAARFAVESDAILREAIHHFSAGTDSDSPGLAMGLLMIRTGLGEIAKRAVALGDEELLDICVQLCVVRSPDRNPSEPRAVGLDVELAPEAFPDTERSGDAE